ncbi:MAG: hypothetical protein HZB25_05245 [Candidatus Eisenbacteria bacterium]|nr:hypothetical protein [Candidatus Eisenbacteria bacterium]
MTAYDVHGQVVAEEFNSGGGHLTVFSLPAPVVAMLRMKEVGQGVDDFTFNTPVLPGTVDVPERGAARGSAVSLRVCPNPGHGSAGLRILAAGPGSLQLVIRIHDLGGRLVRTFAPGRLPAHLVNWDGRDDGGRSVPSGVYLVRWTGGGLSKSSRVTYIK